MQYKEIWWQDEWWLRGEGSDQEREIDLDWSDLKKMEADLQQVEI